MPHASSRQSTKTLLGTLVLVSFAAAATANTTAATSNLVSLRAAGTALESPSAVAGTQKTVADRYGNVPLSFQRNEGQSDAAIQYLAHGPGYQLFLTADEAVLGLQQVLPQSLPTSSDAHPPSTKTSYLRASLVGSNKKAVAEAEQPLTSYTNYLTGKDPAHWHTHVANFGRVRYKNIYPGIDLVYYGKQQQLEYDFAVAPGGDPKSVRLHYDGIDSAKVDEQGNLHLQISGQDVVEHAPVIYQDQGGSRIPVDGHFKLSNSNNKSIDVAFEVGEYDHAQALIIDPVLSYSTLLGGSSGATIDGVVHNAVYGIAVDSGGFAYVTGYTQVPDFPHSGSAFDSTLGGVSDAFVTKFNSDGTGIVYSTYLGGSGSDISLAIKIDGSGAAYVTGNTQSVDFPVTPGAYQATLNGTQNAFIAKLSQDGSSLDYATYLGGSSWDWSADLAIDASGEAFVGGMTESSNFPTTSGAFSTVLKGNSDAFVSKLSSDGKSLLYSTYLGGAGSDSASGIAIDGTGSAYLTGWTGSTNFPTTANAYQQARPGVVNIFVSKLSNDGKSLVYSTYLGGANHDYGDKIVVDKSGAAYMLGNSNSANYPVSGSAYQTQLSGAVDAAITKLSADGTQLIYSTYLGSTGEDYPKNLAVDTQGRVYVVGTTGSRGFPVTTNALHPTFNGTFESELSADGSQLLYSSFFGGAADGTTTPAGIALDNSGGVYIAGGTTYNDFPTTPGAFQTAPGTNSWSIGFGFVTKLAPLDATPTLLTFNNVKVGTSSASQAVTFTNSGKTAVSFESITVGTPQFKETDNCGYKLYAAATCTLNVSFSPSAIGTATDTLAIATSSGTALISLTGKGTGASANVTPGTLPFGNQSVGTTSNSQSVTLGNNGTTTLNLRGIIASSGYNQQNDCGTSLAVGKNCTIYVSFSPALAGSVSGTLSISSNAMQGTLTVALTGTGTAPAISLSPASLDFGSHYLGSATSKTIKLTNTGNELLGIWSLGTAGNYWADSDCGNLNPGAKCTITVTFKPELVGVNQGNLTIYSNTSTSPDTFPLTGIGSGPMATPSPTSLDFGNVKTGTTSRVQTIRLTNTGSTYLQIGSIDMNGHFGQTSSCPAQLAGGASCSINVTFSPTGAGLVYGAMTITSNSNNSPLVVPLSGTGT